MTVIKGLGDFLLAETSISALVGMRLYPGRLPQKVTGLTSANAAIVLSDLDDIAAYHHRGPNAQSRALWQVDCWAQMHDVAIQVGRLVRWRLSGYQGFWFDNNSPAAFIRVQMIRLQTRLTTPEVDIHQGLWRHSADYYITYSASEDLVLT
jgi:hypothetical protein